MSRPWFDPETGVLLLDEYAAQMPSFAKIMEDGVITDEEMWAHAQTVIERLRELEAALSPHLKDVATEALCELAVLHALERRRALAAALGTPR